MFGITDGNTFHQTMKNVQKMRIPEDELIFVYDK